MIRFVLSPAKILRTRGANPYSTAENFHWCTKSCHFRSVFLGVCLSLAAAAHAAQPSVTLAWNPVTDSIAGYRLYRGGAARNYTATQYTISNLTSGATYYFAVTAFTSAGAESDYSTELSYTVPADTNSGTPPVISLTSPANGAVYTEPANMNLSANVTANGHLVTRVQFYNGATLLGEKTNSPYSYSWNNVLAGNYSVKARLVYDAGVALDSSVAGVTVASSRPTPPPPTNSTLILAADSGSITAPFTVSNGRVSQSISTGLTGSGRAAYTFTLATNGDYLVSALVNAPDTASNSFYVNIDAEPTDPTMIWDIPVTSGLTNRTVAWRGNGTSDMPQFVPKTFTLTAGSHQLIIRGREPGTQLGTITISSASTNTAPPPTPLPVPWLTADIGNPGATGSASYNNGDYTVSGAGNISGTTDNFRFVYQSLTGDGDIRVRISSVQNTGNNAFVGVMFRETLAANAKCMMMGISPTGVSQSQWRLNTGLATQIGSTGTLSPPNAWLRLQRTADTLNFYTSTDGNNWTLLTSQRLGMAINAYLGLAVASGSAGTLNTSTFNNATAVP